MNAELEELLKAFDAFHEANHFDAKRLRALYYSRLEDASQRTGHPIATIDHLIRYKHGPWKLAQKRTPTIPPSA